MNVGLFVSRDTEEGQSPGGNVQVHAHTVGGAVGRLDACLFLLVVDAVTFTSGAPQAPRLWVPSEPAGSGVATPTHPLLPLGSHRYVDLSTPLHLPVAATSKIRPTQQLWPLVKAIAPGLFWIATLQVPRQLPVAVAQCQEPVDGVCVHVELDPVCKRTVQEFYLEDSQTFSPPSLNNV